MYYTRKQMLEIVKPCPCFGGFDDYYYESKIVPTCVVIHNYHTCQNNRLTFIELAKYMCNGSMSNVIGFKKFTRKVNQLLVAFDAREINIPVFKHSDLQERWPSEYPQNSKLSGEALIVEDGNTRLTALAKRYLQNKILEVEQIVVWLGHHP